MRQEKLPHAGWSHATTVSGLCLLLLLGLLAIISAPPSCEQASMSDAVLQLQFARSDAEVAAVFGSGDRACRMALAANLTTSLYVDLLAFVPVFAFFAAAFFIAQPQASSEASAAGIGLVLLAAVADTAETAMQIQGLTAAGAELRYSPAAHLATILKYVALAGSGFLATYVLATTRPLFCRLAGIAAAAGAVLVLAGVARFIPPEAGYAMLLVWAAMFGWSIWATLVPLRAAAAETAERKGA